jgi:hypothetical protein
MLHAAMELTQLFEIERIEDKTTGVKCLECGKELTELHQEESQLLGYGSGCNDLFAQSFDRYRQNEASDHFTDSQELESLEKEKLRREKERREMELSEIFFYDSQLPGPASRL